MGNLADIRTDYKREEFNEQAALPNAVEQFERWFDEAVQANIPDVNAMTLATAAADGRPAARIVLLKGISNGEFEFYTNYESPKGRDLAENPRAALVFYWNPFARQIRIEGAVEKLTREESETYFQSRPKDSQLGAWASEQSSAIPSRTYLEDRFRQAEQTYTDDVAPLPPYWGGYRLLPSMIEFWQGRPNRMHDRLRYERTPHGWGITRLAP